MAFDRSKHEIVESIKEGVKIFDPARVTALSTDYSTTGVRYFMYQQYCSQLVHIFCSTSFALFRPGDFLRKDI